MQLIPLWMDGPWHHSSGFGFFPFWPLLMIVFWFGFFRFIGGARRRQRHAYGPPATPPQDPALVTLRERFARGEIDRAEYEERRSILLGRQQAPAQGGDKAASEDRANWPDLV